MDQNFRTPSQNRLGLGKRNGVIFVNISVTCKIVRRGTILIPLIIVFGAASTVVYC